MKFYVLTGCLILFVLQLLAQEAPNFNGSSPGSINATSSSKAINIPVNYFTGIPNISIPIHQYSRNGIFNHVSLDYFAGGVKVDEQATNTGTNWQISAGGAVIRSLRGLPDDCPGRGFLYTPEVEPGNVVGRDATRFSTVNYAKDSIDSEQDIFQFNVDGHSGSFIIGKNGKIILIPQQNIKVRWSTGNITGVTLSNITAFIITVEDGTRYLFDVPEISTRNALTQYDQMKSYVSAWYLKSIISPFSEDTISFNYNNVLIGRNVKLPSCKFDHTGEPTTTYTNNDFLVVNTKYLAKVSFPYSLTLNFIYDSLQRKDAPGEYALSRIELKDSVVRTGYRFEYQYFSNKGTIYPYNSTDTGISKLMLYKLYQYTQFQTLNPYEFTYSPYKVPKVDNPSQDHWGYFNNKPNNDLIPSLGILAGANREPDADYAKSGTLTAIKYPNGAKTLFEYEVNDCKYYYYQEARAEMTGPSPNYAQTKAFTIFKYPGRTATVNITVAGRAHCPATFTLKDLANTTIDQFQTNGSSGGTYKTYTLGPGSYTLVCAPTGSCGSSTIPECTIRWANDVQDSTYALTGGIRIKRLTMQDSLNQGPPLIRDFKYQNPDNSSSGFALFKPRYDYIFSVFNRNDNGYNKEYTARVSSPLNNLDYIWGTSTGYARVEESTPGNGKVVYEFTTYKDLNYFPAPPQFPYAVKTYPFWEIGLPRKVTVMDKFNTVLRIEEKKYKFFLNTFSDTAFKSIKLLAMSQTYSNTAGYLSTGYAADAYYPITGKTVLDSITEKTVSGTDTLLSCASFSYDSLYNLVSTKTRIGSDLQKYTRTNIYYPYNYTINGPVKQLRDSGIILPVAMEKWLVTLTGEYLQDATINGFSLINSTQIKLQYTYKLQSAAPVPVSTIGAFTGAVLNRNIALIPPQTMINTYTSKGIATEITNSQTGKRQTVIWDDEQQIASATVNNSGSTEIAYTSFEGKTNGNWNIPIGTINYSDAITGRKSFVLNGNISTTVGSGKEYLVTYWSKSTALNVNGTTAIKLFTYRGWSCYQHNLPNTTSTITITGSNITIDELRAYPANTTMATNTADITGISSTCDEFNRITYYEYDDLGRRRLTKDVENNILEMNCYGSAGQKVNCNVIYKNNAVSRRFVQSNCVGGTIPDTAVYTVPAASYTSLRSQYAADSMAMSAVLANGQAYANSIGTCGAIYAKLSYENANALGSLDVVVRFYADAACTIPRNVTNLAVTVGVNDPCIANPGDVTATVSGVSAIVIPDAIYYYGYTECDPGGFPCYYYECNVDFYLKPGPYVIK